MDVELVERARRGDVEAFSRITETRMARLYAVARLILRDEDAAADAVQDALLGTWRDLPSLRDPDRFDAWLRRLLVRACHRVATARRAHRLADFEVGVDPSPATPDAQSLVAIRDQLERGFRRLSNEQRTVVVLRHYLGLPLAEIAEATGVPVGTVDSRLSRAIEALRAGIQADDRPAYFATEMTR